MAQGIKREQIENGRAAYAYDAVVGFVNDPKNEKELHNYRSYMLKLSAMIQTNGLAQAMAFYYSKGGTYRKIYEQIQKWMESLFGPWEEETERLEAAPGGRRDDRPSGKNDRHGANDNDGWIRRLLKCDSREYRMMTVETLALVQWMARIAAGKIKSASDGDGAKGASGS